jgi:hypothetical protein
MEETISTPVRGDGAGAEDQDALAAELAAVRDKLARDDAQGAREQVQRLAARWPDAPRVRHYLRVLARPEVGPGGLPPIRSLDVERAWLREHAREYAGCWLAVLGDQLIAANPDPATVIAAAQATPGGTEALLHFEPATSG